MIFSVFPKCDGLTPAQTLSAGLCFRTLSMRFMEPRPIINILKVYIIMYRGLPKKR